MNDDVLKQYQAVRNGTGYALREDVGFIKVYGPDRFKWLQGMVSNDMFLLQNHAARRLSACLLNATGHIISDMALENVYDAGINPYMRIELPRSNVEKVCTVLDRYLITEDVALEKVSDDETERLSRRVVGSGEAGEVEIGPEAQEILRVEDGIPKYGVDMDESTIALEAGLGPTHISFTKGCYVGQEIIARIDSRGHTNRALTGFVVESGDLPVFGDKIFGPSDDGGEKESGRITSVIAESPAMNYAPIAMGYARHEHRTPDTVLHSRGEGREAVLRVVTLPFYHAPAS